MTAPQPSEAAATVSRFLESYYRLRPVNASFTGVRDYDADLPDWSPEGLQAARQEMKRLRADVVAALGPDATGGPDRPFDTPRLDLLLADAFLEIQLAEIDGRHFQRGNPSLVVAEAVFGVVALLLSSAAPSEDRLHALEARLHAIPGFLAGARRTLHDTPCPPLWSARATDECLGARLLLEDGLAIWCQQHGVVPAAMARLMSAAQPATLSFRDFARWLGEAATGDGTELGCGPELFDLLLHRGHWCARSRSELLADARQQFQEAVSLRDAMAGEAAGDWPAVQSQLAETHPTASGYLAAFQSTWKACRSLAIEHDVVSWPNFPLRYVPIPHWARAAAPHLYFLHYRSPAPHDLPPIVEYLVPPIDDLDADGVRARLRAVNDEVIKLNHVVHHGALGHHVQNFFAYRASSRIARVAAVDCASRIGMFCGGSLAEGWACYATDVMEEHGFLTANERVAQQHSRVRQLGRMIVDIELHQRTMDEASAIAWYRDRVGMSEPAAVKEVTRTSMFPGTGSMYWLGWSGIRELRDRQREAQGPRFSLRTFHDRLLSYGAIPVPLLATAFRGHHWQGVRPLS